MISHVLFALSAPNRAISGTKIVSLENPSSSDIENNSFAAKISTTPIENGDAAVSKKGEAKEEQNADSMSQA